MSAMVTAESLSVRHGTHVRLDDVSLEVPRAHVHALVGPNGSGKSTLLDLLAGTLAPTSGEVRVDGVRWDSLGAREAARKRALLTQETPLTFPYTVRDVVSWGRLPWRGMPPAEDDDDVIAEVVEEQDVSALLDRKVPELSVGEQARVHLARVLAQRAPLLLLDEADAALDLAGQAHLDAAIRRRRQAGDAIIIVGHDLGRIAAVADTVTVLSGGRVVAQGPTSTTLTAETLSRAYGVAVASGDVSARRVFWVVD